MFSSFCHICLTITASQASRASGGVCIFVTSQVLCSAWKDDGTTVFSAGCDKIVKMWPLMSGAAATPIGQHDAPIREMAYINEMNLLVTASWDKTVK